MKPKDGGLVFPGKRPEKVTVDVFSPDEWQEIQYSGLTVRQFYAGCALIGNLASYHPGARIDESGAAAFSFRMADAMLAAETKETP